MRNIEKVCAFLDEQKVHYTITHHEPVYTMEEMERLGLYAKGEVAKNLFLCDDKGKIHFLVSLKKDKTADLKSLAEKLECKKLRFASEQRLMQYLGLEKGAVSPLGILNDEERHVTMVFDRDLVDCPCLGVHPNDNRATLYMAYADLKGLIEAHGNSIRIMSA